MNPDIDENIQWELIHRIVKHMWEEKDQLVSFNIAGKTSYSKSEILELDKKNTIAFQKFSNLVHQIPRSVVFDEKTDEFMWEAYQKIFYCGTIARQQYNNVEKDSAFAKKEAAYNEYSKAYETLQMDYIAALENNAANEVIDAIKLKLKEKITTWKALGHKAEVERAYDNYFSESNFSFASFWSRWKTKALEADVAGFTGPFSRFGDFNAHFGTLLQEHNWKTKTVRYKTLNGLKILSINESNTDIAHLISNISSIKFKYQVLDIERDWFTPEVFRSDFWRWHKLYNGGPVSNGEAINGHLTGALASYISEVYFLKDIEFRSRSNMVFDLLEWVGGMFSELPYETFIPSGKDEYFLAGFNATIVPPCPNPNPGLAFIN